MIHAIQHIGQIAVVLGKCCHLRLGDGPLFGRQCDLARQARLVLCPVDFCDTWGLLEDAALEPGRGLKHDTVAFGDLRLLFPHQLGRHHALGPAGEPGAFCEAPVVQQDMRVLVRPVIMHREHVIPLIAVIPAFEEMLGPVECDLAYLIYRDVGRKRQQHMRGKPELRCAPPGLRPGLHNLRLLRLGQHGLSRQWVGHRCVGVDRLVVHIRQLVAKALLRLAPPCPDPLEHRGAALRHNRLQQIARRGPAHALVTATLPPPCQPRVYARLTLTLDALRLPELAHDGVIEGERLRHGPPTPQARLKPRDPPRSTPRPVADRPTL